MRDGRILRLHGRATGWPRRIQIPRALQIGHARRKETIGTGLSQGDQRDIFQITLRRHIEEGLDQTPGVRYKNLL